MELTKQNKKSIDGLSYTKLLKIWRFGVTNLQWLEGATGKYWGERMSFIKPKNHVAISKRIGWTRPVIVPMVPLL